MALFETLVSDCESPSFDSLLWFIQVLFFMANPKTTSEDKTSMIRFLTEHAAALSEKGLINAEKRAEELRIQYLGTEKEKEQVISARNSLNSNKPLDPFMQQLIACFDNLRKHSATVTDNSDAVDYTPRSAVCS